MKCFCLKVFARCDDHTLNLRLVGRLEQGQCLAFVGGGGGRGGAFLHPVHWVESLLGKSLGSQI